MYETNRDPQTSQIIGAAMEVHRNLHRGLYEDFYCEALAIEFRMREIPFEAQCPVQVEYSGLLLNFGAKSLEHKRMVM